MPVDKPVELPAAWTALQNSSSGTERDVETPKDPRAKHGMAYKYTTLRPSVETNNLTQFLGGSRINSQKVAYAAHVILENEATNHVMLTAQLFFRSLLQQAVQGTSDAHT